MNIPAVFCPHCRNTVLNDGSLAGQVATCPHCSGPFTMPAAGVAPQYQQPPIHFQQPTIVEHRTVIETHGGNDQQIAGLASFFCPGLGQLVQNRVGAAALWFFLAVFSAVLCIVYIGLVLLPIVWIINILDAVNYRPRRSRRRR